MIFVSALVLYSIFDLFVSEGPIQWVWSTIRFVAAVTLGILLFSDASLAYSAAAIGLASVVLLGMWAVRSEVQSRDT